MLFVLRRPPEAARVQGWGKAGITLHLETPLNSHNPWGAHRGCLAGQFPSCTQLRAL